MPAGCTDIIASQSDAQNENKEFNADEASDNANKDTKTENEKSDKGEKAEKADKPSKLQNTTYIFTRYSKQPAVVIPSADYFTTAVRCCPTIFKLRPHKENCPPMIDLPYRMIYAVASKSSVYLYDTQQRLPFGSVSNIHYSRLTDISWSSDGKILIASSFDGFCTLIAFENGELGEVYDGPINLVETDDKENQSKKKRTSNDKKNKTSPKEPTTEQSKTTPMKAISTKDNTQLKPVLEIPETIISTASTFESPEYKEKQATPISVRRQPRTTPSTSGTPKPNDSDPSSAKKPKPIAVRRQPRNILPSPVVVSKSGADQDEALDAWPIPIDSVKPIEEKVAVEAKKAEAIIFTDDEEDMHLVYEGESEMTLMTNDAPIETKAEQPARKSEPSTSEHSDATPDAKSQKTPRRVEFRTISTPKSKKKLIH